MSPIRAAGDGTSSSAMPWDRFWSSVHVGEDSDCWPWRGGKHTDGYGRFQSNGAREYAHRLAYLSTLGPIPDGMHVCHRCDNPPCCNPRHLFLGTPAENAADKTAKGRQGRVVGTKHPAAKLDDEAVRRIRALIHAGAPYRAVAAEYGVHPSTVWQAVKGRCWSHVE